MIRALALSAALFAAQSAAALDLPGTARLARSVQAEADRYGVPVAPFKDGIVPSIDVRGAMQQQAWHIPGAGLTPVQLIDPVVQQLEADGYRVAFSCETNQCGGFDFRFGVDVMQAPDMFVDLRGFRFVTLTRGPEGNPSSAVTLLASAAQDVAYLQLTEISPDAAFDVKVDASGPVPAAQPVTPRLSARGDASDLLTLGSIVLDGVDFETGATDLGTGPFPALDALAAFLKENPGLRVALVGHTDSVGSLEGNIRISKRRAESVRQRLIDDYNLPPAQLDAEGMGYLAPRASNLTVAGRETNRRVEAIALTFD